MSKQIAAILLLVDLVDQARHEKTRQDKRRGNAAVTDVLLDLRLAVEVGDVGETSLGGLGGVDEDEKIRCFTPAALEASVTALPWAISVSALMVSQKLVTRKTACAPLTAGAAASGLDMSACLSWEVRSLIIALKHNSSVVICTYDNNLDALFGQCLGRWLGSIASNTSDLELLGQDGISLYSANHGAALVAGGAPHSQDLGHVEFWLSFLAWEKSMLGEVMFVGLQVVKLIYCLVERYVELVVE